MWYFETCMYNGKINQTNIYFSNLSFMFSESIKIYYFSFFKLYNAVLITNINVQWHWSSELFSAAHMKHCTLCTSFLSPFPPLYHQFLVITFVCPLCMKLTFLDFKYMWSCTFFLIVSHAFYSIKHPPFKSTLPQMA